MNIGEIRKTLEKLGFLKDPPNPSRRLDSYYRNGMAIRLSPFSMHITGNGISLKMNLDDIRLISMDNRLLRITFAGGHHSFLL